MANTIVHTGIGNGETEIDCELQVDDYCVISSGGSEDYELRIGRRTYDTILKKWLFYVYLSPESYKFIENEVVLNTRS